MSLASAEVAVDVELLAALAHKIGSDGSFLIGNEDEGWTEELDPTMKNHSHPFVGGLAREHLACAGAGVAVSGAGSWLLAPPPVSGLSSAIGGTIGAGGCAGVPSPPRGARRQDLGS